MKITMLSRFFDNRTAGLARVSTELWKGLNKKGIGVEPYAAKGASLVSYMKYLLIDIPRLKKGGRIFHAITPMEAMLTPGGQTIVTVPDLILLKHPQYGGSGVGGSKLMQWAASNFARFGYFCATEARHLACISEETKEDLCSTFKVSREKVSVIRLGIREDLEPDPFAFPHKRLLFGYLGQLDRRKRVDLLVKAFVANPQLDAELWIAGTGRDKPDLKRLAGDDTRIVFKGYIPDEEIGAFYNALDWFIFPTAAEGYGLPPVEAMACKVATVMMEDAIVPNDVKSRCVLTEDLREFFGYVNDIQVSEEFIEGNYHFAKEHSWPECVDSYIKLYQECIDD